VHRGAYFDAIYSKGAPLRSPVVKKTYRAFGPRAPKKRGWVGGREWSDKNPYAKKRPMAHRQRRASAGAGQALAPARAARAARALSTQQPSQCSSVGAPSHYSHTCHASLVTSPHASSHHHSDSSQASREQRPAATAAASGAGIRTKHAAHRTFSTSSIRHMHREDTQTATHTHTQ
jgi:hypothetical protein